MPPVASVTAWADSDWRLAVGERPTHDLNDSRQVSQLQGREQIFFSAASVLAHCLWALPETGSKQPTQVVEAASHALARSRLGKLLSSSPEPSFDAERRPDSRQPVPASPAV